MSKTQPALATKKYYFIFKKKIHAGIFFYSVLLLSAGLLAYFDVWGLIPYLMIMVSMFGLWHLCLQILLADPNDHLSDMHEQKTGKKQKSVVFFIDR